MATSQVSILIALGVVVLAAITAVVIAPSSTVQILGFSAVVVAGLFQQLQTVNKLDAAATKVEEVKTVAAASAKKTAAAADEVKGTLAASNAQTKEALEGIAKVGQESQKTGEAVHILVNSAMSDALEAASVALRRIAELTQNPDDIMAAESAEVSFRRHENKQAIVDKRRTA
jgi:hypothetical protein